MQKLRERRRVLGIDDDAADQQASAAGAGTTQSADGRGDAAMQAPEEEGQQGQAPDESEAAVQAVLSGAVAGVVLRSAIKAIPQDLGFRARLLELLAGADFAGARALEAQVLEYITRDFGQVGGAVCERRCMCICCLRRGAVQTMYWVVPCGFHMASLSTCCLAASLTHPLQAFRLCCADTAVCRALRQ